MRTFRKADPTDDNDEFDPLAIRVEPIQTKEESEAIETLRKTRAYSYAVSVPLEFIPSDPTTPPDPVNIFTVVFKLTLDAASAAGIRQKLLRHARHIATGRREDGPGFIYCFNDLADTPDILKIGRTTRTPDRRLMEWERDLSPEEGQSIILTFAYFTQYNEMAEAVIHDVLEIYRLRRRNPRTNELMKEFFRIDNALAAGIFVRETIKYVHHMMEVAQRFYGGLAGVRPPARSSSSTGLYLKRKR